MASTQKVRIYVTFPIPADGMPLIETSPFFNALHAMIVKELNLPPSLAGSFEVEGYPTSQWSMYIPGRVHVSRDLMQVVQLHFPQAQPAMLDDFFRAAAAKNWRAGVDLSGSAADYWCPATGDPSFGTRANLDARIGSAKIKDLTGAGVNVVIVDRGLDSTRMPPGSFNGGGWTYTPGTPTAPGTPITPGSARGADAEHGLMLVRNIRALAPNALFFDMPLIPPAILNIPLFMASAHAAFVEMQDSIAWLRTQPGGDQPWVIVNAWALFDRRSDLPKGSGGAGDDGNHPFHSAVQGLTVGGSDVVFVAGNCGQYCPDDRCGPGDIGPGHSISAASAYAEVLTVGAVRVDGLPLGYSSQGPGLIAVDKPDVCTPSNFGEVTNPGQISAGTSAASAVAAGVVAALRTKSKVTPAYMITALRQGAGGTICDPQLGFGIINAGATRAILGI